jgi:hypothetical protein
VKGGHRIGFVIMLLGSACAAAPKPVRPQEIVQRGVLVARGWSIAPLAKGPALVHVYSEGTGGLVYIAPASSEVGEGCSVGSPGGALAQAPLEPERRLTVAIRDGEVVCLYSQAHRTVEVLWHAHRVSPVAPEFQFRPATLAAAKK